MRSSNYLFPWTNNTKRLSQNTGFLLTATLAANISHLHPISNTTPLLSTQLSLQLTFAKSIQIANNELQIMNFSTQLTSQFQVFVSKLSSLFFNGSLYLKNDT